MVAMLQALPLKARIRGLCRKFQALSIILELLRIWRQLAAELQKLACFYLCRVLPVLAWKIMLLARKLHQFASNFCKLVANLLLLLATSEIAFRTVDFVSSCGSISGSRDESAKYMI